MATGIRLAGTKSSKKTRVFQIATQLTVILLSYKSRKTLTRVYKAMSDVEDDMDIFNFGRNELIFFKGVIDKFLY